MAHRPLVPPRRAAVLKRESGLETSQQLRRCPNRQLAIRGHGGAQRRQRRAARWARRAARPNQHCVQELQHGGQMSSPAVPLMALQKQGQGGRWAPARLSERPGSGSGPQLPGATPERANVATDIITQENSSKRQHQCDLKSRTKKRPKWETIQRPSAREDCARQGRLHQESGRSRNGTAISTLYTLPDSGCLTLNARFTWGISKFHAL